MGVVKPVPESSGTRTSCTSITQSYSHNQIENHSVSPEAISVSVMTRWYDLIEHNGSFIPWLCSKSHILQFVLLLLLHAADHYMSLGTCYIIKTLCLDL